MLHPPILPEPFHSAVAHTGRFTRSAQMDEGAEHQRRVAIAVSRAQRGDREALRFLYVSFADNVYGYVSSLIHDEHEAEDVTQAVFAKLMMVLPKYQRREVPFAAWILRVARNAALDHLRQRRPIPCEEVRGEDGAHDPHDAAATLDLVSALASLPEEQREVVVLRHVAGMTPREIAAHLGKSEPSIHGLHHRGRGALRAALDEMDALPMVMAS